MLISGSFGQPHAWPTPALYSLLVAVQTDIERSSSGIQCSQCSKKAEFILKTDNTKDAFHDGARQIAYCRDDLSRHLAKNPGLMAQILVSLIEQRL